VIRTPVGALGAEVDASGAIAALTFGGGGDGTAELRRQLAEYFSGERRAFDLRLAPRGTPWQRAVWAALLTVPYGETIGYAELAARAGRPGAARAAGAANGRNPIAIVLPCHRVVGAGGRLTGYAGGVDAKAWLLALERGERTPPPSPGCPRPRATARAARPAG
jgi:methylated-DNA-[protein]-cysteine S-methyltransferase